MAKTKISEFSSTPANNTDIDSINIAEGCAPSNINDAIRELMAQLKDFQIGSQGDSFNGPIGTSTAAAGAFTTLSASSTVTLSGGTANGVTYLNGSKVLTSGSALTFDGTNLVLGGGGTSGGFAFTQRVSASASPVNAFRVTNGSDSTFDVTLQTSLASIGNGIGSLAFLAAGSEGMRLTSTGLGIGTSSPAYKLDVQTAAGRFQVRDLGGSSLKLMNSTTGGNIGIDSAGGITLIYANGTETARFDASGNLLVGTTASNYRLNVRGGGSAGDSSVYAQFTTADTGTTGSDGLIIGVGVGSSPIAYINNLENSALAFATNGSERARIDSSGNLLVGTTSSIGGKLQVVFDGTSGDGVGLKTNNATLDAVFIRFINSAGSTAGRVYQNGTTSVSYVTTSDQRLKTDKGIATETNVIDNAIVHDYEWKSNNQVGRGLFAQEAYENKPDSVFVGSNELTDDGSFKNPWGVDYSKYVPDLIVHAQQLKKQVQEQQALIQSLKARLDAANL